VPLPFNIPKRGLSEEEAAVYCGVPLSTLKRHGPQPTEITKRTKIYDRRVLYRWLDELAGLPVQELNGAETRPTPEEKLLEAIHARKTALRGTPD
jgi:hypothetical protein